MKPNLEDTFLDGEIYYNETLDKYMIVMAVDSIDEEEAWLAIMWLDENFNTTDADELCIRAHQYDDWKLQEIQ